MVCDNGKARKVKENDLEIADMDNIEEKDPEWLVIDYIPSNHITVFVGDGGSGKTTIWCSIAAAISSGERTFFENYIPDEWAKNTPKKVMFFSAEDSAEYTLKRRLRKNNANMKNILTIDIADERFQDVKFNNVFLEQLIDKYRPTLCIFDPIQAFIPPEIRMGDRNAMRNCLAPLIGYGEKYGVTFLIVMHTNKQSGVWGRKRMSDSSDIWDISRSVLMLGETNEEGIRYISQEKSNYGAIAKTVLFSIEDEVIDFKSYTNKKDRDFVTETDYVKRLRPERDEAKEFILEFLKDETKEIADLDELALAMGITKNALKNAKADLRKEGHIKTWSTGYGQNKKFFVSLIATEKNNE